MRKTLLSVWTLEGKIHGVGNADLLDLPLTAFFASRQCPGMAIRAAMDWAVEQARSKTPVISGLHSPLEQSVLEVMLTAGAPCIMVIARKLDQAHLIHAWLDALQAGRLAVVSMNDKTQQLSTKLAILRNKWVASHSDRIVVAHASSQGALQQLTLQWEKEGRIVEYLSKESAL